MIDTKHDFTLSHRRRNALTGDFVLVSPQRSKRPWSGATGVIQTQKLKHYEANCPLCPGNVRSEGRQNAHYQGVYIFENDFAALNPQQAQNSGDKASALFHAESVSGRCLVICYSPDHSKTMADMEESAIEAVILAWQAESKKLLETFDWVQIFENKGSMMGCSQPHPHGQIWAQSSIPTLGLQELNEQTDYFTAHGRALLLDYVEAELVLRERVVIANDHWVVVVPYWAQWPFETLVLPREKVPHFDSVSAASRKDLAQTLKQLCSTYDRLFDTSFPYSMGWHQCPAFFSIKEAWQLHCHFYPPLLRSATVQKFMVGYELLSETQRDLTPESAAEFLRSYLEV